MQHYMSMQEISNENNLHEVKVKGTRETRICCRSSFSFEKYVSVWRGSGAQCSHEANEGHPISPHALTDARCRDSTNGALKVHTKPLHKGGAAPHNAGVSHLHHEASPQWIVAPRWPQALDGSKPQE